MQRGGHPRRVSDRVARADADSPTHAAADIQRPGGRGRDHQAGPIQGNAVHPYIRRKQGREPVTYAHPLLEPILKDTLGVILYQEQIIEIAMYVAGMTPSGADGFRRAMTPTSTGSRCRRSRATSSAGA